MPAPGTLDARRATILRAVVNDYIRTGEPVGSGTVADHCGLGVSPATIRSEMSWLEERGYLAQPHTSAGRVPTDLGYRYYVDALPRRAALSGPQRREITTFFGESPPDLEEVLRRVAWLLSRLTRYAAVTLEPVAERHLVVRAELVPVGPGALLLVVSDAGRVDNIALELPGDADDHTVDRVSATLEGSLVGLTYEGAARRVSDLASTASEPDRSILRGAEEALRWLGDATSEQHVYLGGVANIAGEEAFEHRGTMRRLFEALEEQGAMGRFLRALAGEGDLTVRIGSENQMAAMREASVILAPYRGSGGASGAIAVIGPTRMTYPTAISAVDVVARRLSDAIGALAG